MKSKSITIFALFAIAISSFAFASFNLSWQVDKSHSAINFSVRHFFTPVNGSFNDYKATINFNPENLEESNIDVAIQVSSIDTKNDRRNGHLKSADFFEAETWPNMTFKSDVIRSTGENEYVATGTLTIKDVSKDFELPFTLLGMGDHPMREGSKIAGISAETVIDRSEFGVGTGDWASDAVVGDKVTVNILLELNSRN